MFTKNNLSKFLVLSTMGVSVLSFSGVSSVQGAAVEPSSSQTLRQDLKDVRSQARCSVSEARIKARITAYEARQAKDVGDFGQIRNKVAEAISKLKEKGADVSKLEGSLATMDAQIATLKADHLKFIDLLKATQGFACGESEGQFKEALNNARNQQKVVIADRTLVKNTLTTIRGQLKDAVNSIK